jgi:serine/threonine protein kinase
MPANRTVLEQVARQHVGTAEVEHLGTGGFASTFKVTDDTGSYALKVVDANLSEDARVQRELSALQRVTHPNVVSYRDTGTINFHDTDYRWLAMDFVEGEPLRARLAAGAAFSPLQAVDIILHAARGAAALWEADTAHRDLSPNNLLITADDAIVIVDLGLARHLDDETITALPTPGTPGWMSPEQVGPSPTHGDWRSDQFVLGLIAYRLLTGTEPYGGNAYERWQGPAGPQLRPARELDPTIPASVSDAVHKMTAREPHRRYLRPAALIADLERARAALAAVAPAEQQVSTPQFILAIGQLKSYATSPGFMTSLGADGVIVDARAAGRTDELLNLTGGASRYIDPHTHLARSPEAVRSVHYKKLPYGSGPAQGTFADAQARRDYCTAVVDAQLPNHPTTVLAPYFYAGPGEQNWVLESLLCGDATRDVLASLAPERGGEVEPVWTTLAVSASWLSENRPRNSLLALVTGHTLDALHLLVHTTQGTFAPLRDQAVLEGLADVLSVMREAEVPVVLGRRGPEGLLGLALGASGWTTGVSAIQQNMSPHPEKKEGGGNPEHRVYVPQLLNNLATPTYQTFAQRLGARIALTTAQGQQLQTENPTMENLTTDQGILLRQHNLLTMRAQARTLAEAAPAARRGLLLGWLANARRLYDQAPPTAAEGESGSFLSAWTAVL